MYLSFSYILACTILINKTIVCGYCSSHFINENRKAFAQDHIVAAHRKPACLLGCVKDCTSFTSVAVQGRTVQLTHPLSAAGSAGKFKFNFQSQFLSVPTCANQ